MTPKNEVGWKLLSARLKINAIDYIKSKRKLEDTKYNIKHDKIMKLAQNPDFIL